MVSCAKSETLCFFGFQLNGPDSRILENTREIDGIETEGLMERTIWVHAVEDER